MSSWSMLSRSEKVNWIVIPLLLLMMPITVAGALKVKSLNSRAGTAPVTPPTIIPDPISNARWSTKWANFTANDFNIHVSDGTTYGRYFRVNPSKPCNNVTGEMVCVSSNPPGLNSQGLHYMTLEVIWFEYDIEMRMFIYLYSDGNRWWSDEIRVFNGQPSPNTEWVYFKGRFFDTAVGQSFNQIGQFKLDAPDPKNNNSPVTLSFSNLKFAAFMNYFPNPTSTPIAVNVCGGIKGLLCPTGQVCIYSGGFKIPPYPDAQGVCQVQATKIPLPTPTPIKVTPSPTQFPDLVILGSIAFNPTQVKVNEPVLISFRMFNMGLSPASPAQYNYVNQADGFSTIDPSNTCTGSTVLNPGQSCTSAYNFLFSIAGTKNLAIQLDPQNLVRESNESNNYVPFSLQISNNSTPTPRSLVRTPRPRPTVPPNCRYSLFRRCLWYWRNN